MDSPRRHLVVEVPSIRQPITKSPGFAKKELSTWKLDLMALCGFGCSYCSSNTGNYLRINREKFADATEEQLGERIYPSDEPDLAMVWPDVLEKIERQIASHKPGWGGGETLVFSMLTDAFSGPPLRAGTTEKALRMLLNGTSFRIRVLTKNSVVGTSQKWRDLFFEHRDRVVVGLSTGSLDSDWARRVEIGCPPPTARIEATRRLQGAAVPTFGMLCPIFPDVLAGDSLDLLIDGIRPELCETVWAEPYNDRSNWQKVRAGYELGSPGFRWFTDVYEHGGRSEWSRYATDLYLRLREKALAEGWMSKLRYLLYENDITVEDARRFPNLSGVLLQSPTRNDGTSLHPIFGEMQRASAAG